VLIIGVIVVIYGLLMVWLAWQIPRRRVSTVGMPADAH
jgi:hypothetical protein